MQLRYGPLLLIPVLGLLFFAKLVFHPSWVLYTDYSDLLIYQVPQMRYLVSYWQQTGEQPLWCPYSFAGMPFVHDLQVGAFYPPHLFLYYLPVAMVGPAPGLTHHNSESGLAGKPCLLVKSKLLDHIFATFRQCIGEYSAL